MKRRWTQIFCVMMSFILFLLTAEPVLATTISGLQEDIKRNQSQLNSVNKEIAGYQDAQEGVEEEISDLDAEMVALLTDINLIQEAIDDKEEDIANTQVAYDAAVAEKDEQYESMKIRIKFMYEKGDSTYLEILLTSQSFADMMNKVEYVEKLYEYDRNLLEEYQAAREMVEALKEKLEEERAELEAQEHELMEEKESLEIILAEKKTLYEDYEAQLSRARQEAAVYKANIRKQNDEIKRLTAAAQEKQSQIDEAKRLEEEARKAQELALQRQAEEEARQNSGGGDSESSSDSSSGSSSKTYASASNYSGSGSKGQQIANYACQFIGNPYVPGGTSLTEGADCSGFVWRVYKDFGSSLPRTSYSMRSSGTGVSYSEAQPGDVVCYAGHVGIYIGGGQIVHASTQKTGIKITHATYKEILSVRRIV